MRFLNNWFAFLNQHLALFKTIFFTPFALLKLENEQICSSNM